MSASPVAPAPVVKAASVAADGGPAVKKKQRKRAPGSRTAETARYRKKRQDDRAELRRLREETAKQQREIQRLAVLVASLQAEGRGEANKRLELEAELYEMRRGRRGGG